MTVVSASWELQKAVVAKAVTDPDVKYYLGSDKTRLLDFFDDSTQTPFAWIGDGDETNSGPACEEATSFLTGHAVTITVVTSDQSGYTKCKPIAQALIKALHGVDLTIEGFQDSALFWRSTSYRRNPDQSAQRMATILFTTELSPTS